MMAGILHEYPDVEQRSDEWYEQRRGMITASTIGSLLTVSPPGAPAYECPECAAPSDEPCISLRGGTPIKTMHSGRASVAAANAETAAPVIEVANNDTARSLTLLLAAERITGHVEPTFISDDMMRGIEDEPRAIEVYSEHFAEVTTTGFMVREFGGFKIGFSPDGLVGDDGLIEIKSRRQKKHLKTVLDDQVPAENMSQIQCGLLVSGRQWLDYVSYSGGLHLWVKRVTPDPHWFAAIRAAAEQFERNAVQMITAYEAATQDLPMTERPDLEIVI